MTLKQKALSGIKWTGLSTITNTLIQLLQLSILAHYLSPSDFGLMAIVYVIIGFSALFMDMGISASIIHKQDITHQQLSSLYWLNIFSGVLLFGIVYVLAPYISQFYDEPKLIPLIRLLSVTFIISAVSNQYKMLFQKALKFDTIAKISMATVFTSLVFASGFAIMGFGVYALVYAAVISSLFNASLFLLFGLREHKPSLVFNYQQIKPMISFGMFQLGERSITYFNAQFDVLLIGKLLGVEALGVYSIAKNLSMRPAKVINPIITRVTFPVMAKIQDDLPRLKNIYLKTINYLSTVNFFIYILLGLLAEPIILTLFGERWHDSIIILQILSLYGAIRSTGNPQGTLILARGRADLGFYLNLIKFLLMPIIIYIGSFWGLTGVAYSLLFLTTIFIFPNWYFIVGPLCGATLNEYIQQILKPALFSVLSALTTTFIIDLLNIENIYIRSMFTIFTMGGLVLYFNLRFNRDFVDIILELIRKKK